MFGAFGNKLTGGIAMAGIGASAIYLGTTALSKSNPGLFERNYYNGNPGESTGVFGPSVHSFIKGTLGDNLALGLIAGPGLDMLGSKMVMSGYRGLTSERGRFVQSGQYRPGARSTAAMQTVRATRSSPKYSGRGFFRKKISAADRIINRLPDIERRMAGSSTYAKVARKIRIGANLKGAASIAGWASVATMAFDVVADGLFNTQMPSRPPTPSRTSSLSGTFTDSGIAYTQRQRALQALHNTQYNGRAVFGNEASMLHA